MELTGTIDIQERTASNGKKFYVYLVNGENAGSAFKSFPVSQGDVVKLTWVQKGQYKNVIGIEKLNRVPPTQPSPVATQDTIAVKTGPVYHPLGFVPHETLLRRDALEFAVSTVKGQLGEKVTKKSLAVLWAAVLETAETYYAWVKEGKKPTETEQVADEGE